VTALEINLGAAFASLCGNWFRSFLTILGVVIGVASVIILVAFGLGAKQEITSQIDSLGTNVAFVLPGKVNKGQSNFNPMGGMGLSNLTQRDVDSLRAVPGVKGVAPLIFMGGAVYRKEKPATICMPIATTPEFMSIRKLGIDSGRFFTNEDLNDPVCVVGIGIRKDLFPNEDPVGKKISVSDHDYRIIGVVKERNIGSGLFGGEELDALIYIPIGVVQRLTDTKQFNRIFLEYQAGKDPEVVSAAAKKVLDEAHHGRDDTSLMRSKELLAMFYKVFTMLAALLLGITSISLVVGGIGIMNIMLVSVTERTREIGIRKTVGARRKDIFYQFLSEAVALSSLGGLMGILLALLVCYLVTKFMPLRPLITGGSILLGFGVCVVVGIVSGVVPAILAARKDPIEAIRYE
jgi:putative ABC transport system permease protein